MERSISKAIANRLGGDIEAVSQLGPCSAFALSIPWRRALPVLSVSPQEDQTTLREAPAQAIRVLVAEDNLANQRVLQIILEPFGFELTIVNNGQEALDAVSSREFHIILMDMEMPVMDGLSATRAIRAMEAARGAGRVPILMITSNGMPEHVSAALAAGCDQHLKKPITPKALAEAISKAFSLS